MSLLGSAPDGFSTLGWRRFLMAAGVAWLAPALLGALMLAVQWLLGTQGYGDGWLMLWALSVLMLLSPALSWFGLVLAAPAVAVLMDRGWFGWVPALALGIAAGGVTGWLMGNPLAVTFGAAIMAVLRAAMARLCPEAFRAEGA